MGGRWGVGGGRVGGDQFITVVIIILVLRLRPYYYYI